MMRSLVSIVVASWLAAGVALAGPSGEAVDLTPSWANDADALPTGDPLEPRIVERPELALAGVVATAPDVYQMDFHGLWQRFESAVPGIRHQVEGAAYELHVQTEIEPAMHFAIAGVQVTTIEELPAEVFVKVIPASTYAVFTIKFVDGFEKVYDRMWAWIETSPYTVDPFVYDIQRYGDRFTSPEDPESEVDIYVPVRLK
jgi:AraC family transcriptional regulator